jgi:sugar (pentulose or hexulose) kinase
VSGPRDNPYLIGLDVGTSRVKAVAFDRAGAVVTSAELPTPWQQDGGGTSMDAGELRDVVLTVVGRSAAELPSPVAGIGVTGMGEAGVLMDGRGRPLAPIRAWHDRRADVATVRAATGEDAFHAAAGLRLDSLPSLPKILQLRRDHPGCAAAVRFDSVPEWAVRCLGGTPDSELSLASRTGLLDVVTARPWPPAVALLGVDLLGEPRVAGTPQGTATAGGLPTQVRGAVLVVGGHDHQCAAFAAGAARDATLFDSLGTAEALLQFRIGPVDRRLVAEVAGGPGTMTFGLTVVGGHYCLMAALRTGMKLEMVASALGSLDRRQRAELADAGLAVLRERDGVPEADAELLPDGVRLTLRAGADPGRIWAATVLACVEEATPALERIRAVVGAPSRVVASGGWSHDACLWEAKRRQLPGVVRTAVPEAGAAGAAYLAGSAAGLLAAPGQLAAAPWGGARPTSSRGAAEHPCHGRATS